MSIHVQTITTITAFVLLGVQSRAQQTIFNVPTTDILDRGSVYAELDISLRPSKPKFSSFVPRVVVGTGSNFEIGLNLTGNVQPGDDDTTLVPAVKYRFYQNHKKEVALIAGVNFLIPFKSNAYKFGTYFYVAGSKTIKKSRLTAGAYVSSRSVFAPNAVKAGGQFGFEHSINDKCSIAADWITGKHASGYFTPGVIYKPHPKLTTYWSYSIGNTGASNGNHFFLIELGYNVL